MRSIVTKALYDQRRALLGWGLGLALLVGLTVAFWPVVRDNEAYSTVFEDAPPAVQALTGGADLGTPTGYLRAELYAMTVPALMLVYAIGRGAATIAGEEDRGTIEVVLAQPVRRRWFVAGTFLGLVAGTAILGAVLFASAAATVMAVQMGVSMAGLGAMTAMAVLFAVTLGGVTQAIGAATGRRGVTIGAGAAVAVASFFLHSFAPLLGLPGVVRGLSPWYHYIGRDPLTHGLDAVNVLVLGALAVVALLVSVWTFDRRDLRV